MSEITEPAKQMAADLANAEVPEGNPWRSQEFEYRTGSGLRKALARLCARTIERDALLVRMQEDMAEIAEQADGARTTGPAWDSDALANIRVIAARYRVEADPLVEALNVAFPNMEFCVEAKQGVVRAELAKRGIALGAAK